MIDESYSANLSDLFDNNNQNNGNESLKMVDSEEENSLSPIKKKREF